MRTAYESLPRPLRAAAGVAARALPVRMRYGAGYCDESDLIERTRRSPEEVAAIVAERLARVAAAAFRSPYWAQALREAGVTHAYALEPSGLSALPLLTKDTVRARLEDMLDPSSAPDSRKYVTTGGTTGAPLGVWIDKDASPRDWAHVMDAWGELGYRLDDKRVVLRGVRLGNAARRELTYYEPLRRELYVSVFDLDEEHLPGLRSSVDAFGARFLHGYPSSLEVLGRYYRASGGAIPELDGVFAVSENLYPGQREYLEGLFEAPVLAFYGMSEKAAFAAECVERDGYHVHEIYGLVELVDELGRTITEPGVRGEIVATGLLSSCVPLLRYRTGDFSSWMTGTCACGRRGPRLGPIEGRWTREYLVTKRGSKVHMTALNLHSPVFDHVQRFRFVQEKPGVVKLLVVPGHGYTDEDPRRIRNELEGKLSGLVDLEIVRAESLELSPRGKGSFIEQRIPEREGRQ